MAVQTTDKLPSGVAAAAAGYRGGLVGGGGLAAVIIPCSGYDLANTCVSLQSASP